MKYGEVTGALLISISLCAPTVYAVDSKDSKSSRQSKSDAKIHTPTDCANIKAGTVDKNAEAAAQKDCQSSQDRGAGMGTSSGTGSGKMPPGGGPR
jgi:hypothetical protein